MQPLYYHKVACLSTVIGQYWKFCCGVFQYSTTSSMSPGRSGRDSSSRVTAQSIGVLYSSTDTLARPHPSPNPHSAHSKTLKNYAAAKQVLRLGSFAVLQRRHTIAHITNTPFFPDRNTSNFLCLSGTFLLHNHFRVGNDFLFSATFLVFLPAAARTGLISTNFPIVSTVIGVGSKHAHPSISATVSVMYLTCFGISPSSIHRMYSS